MSAVSAKRSLRSLFAMQIRDETSESVSEVRHTRRPHRKVRTGCLTCKIRRKKCDETRPACERCTSTGRKCDGYDPAPSAVECREITGHVSLLSRWPIVLGPVQDRTDLELHCFSYFCHQTVPLFASYFETSMWRTEYIQGVQAIYHPVFFSVAAAVGAVHRRYTYGISPEAFEYCGHAVKLYAKAVRVLENLRKEQGSLVESDNAKSDRLSTREVVVISDILLGLFQAFQGDFDTSTKSFRQGLRQLLGQPMTLLHSEQRPCTLESRPRVLCNLTHQLLCRAIQLFGAPIQILATRSAAKPSLPPIPETFNDLVEARDYLFTEVDWVQHAPSRVWEDLQWRREADALHMKRLDAWSRAYIALRKMVQHDDFSREAHTLLSLTRSAVYLLVWINLFLCNDDGERLPLCDLDSESHHEAGPQGSLSRMVHLFAKEVSNTWTINTHVYHDAVARIKAVVESMLAEHPLFEFAYDKPRHHDIGLSSSAGHSRYCQSHNNDDSNIRNILGIYGLAGRVGAIEEAATCEAVRAVIPQGINPSTIDTCVYLESRKVLVRYYYPDEFAPGLLWWRQEWWAF